MRAMSFAAAGAALPVKNGTTFETAEVRMPQVVKQNGQRVEFDREKVRVSFQRALHKRPVPTQLVDEAIDRIAQKVLASGEREIRRARLVSWS